MSDKELRRTVRPAGGGRRSFNLMQFDTDKDGKVSKAEAPERMQAMFGMMDSNGDGFIDAGEIATLRERFKKRGGEPRGGREGGGPNRGPGGDGELRR